MMKSDSLRSISLILASLALVSSVVAIDFYLSQPKVGVIDNSKLLAGFKGMQEAQQQLQAVQQQRTFEMDSLRVNLEAAYKQLPAQGGVGQKTKLTQKEQEVVNMRSSYDQKAGLYSRATQAEQEQALEQVTVQLNAYVQAYAQLHNYDYILGAAGTGNLWYLSEGEDITESVLAFVNAKYEGQ